MYNFLESLHINGIDIFLREEILIFFTVKSQELLSCSVGKFFEFSGSELRKVIVYLLLTLRIFAEFVKGLLDD